MEEKIAKLGERQLQQGLTYDQVAHLFVEQTSAVVKDAVQILKRELDAIEESELPEMEEELGYFFLFALDYWWQESLSCTQEQKRTLEKVLFQHLNTGFGYDPQGQAAWHALQERFVAFGQVANEQGDDSAKLHGFAEKLSEYCGTGYPYFAILAPSLFKTALDTISVLKAES